MNVNGSGCVVFSGPDLDAVAQWNGTVEKMDTEITTPLDAAELERRHRDLDDVIEVIRPAMRADGGDLELVGAEYATGVVHVRMIGACGSCAVAGMTLTDGVERILKQRLSWVSEVLGDVEASEVTGYGGWVGQV